MFRRIMTALAVAGLFVPRAAQADLVAKPTLSISAEERYDDDLLLRTEAATPLNGELMTKITPRGGLKLSDRTFELDAWYAPDFQFRYFSRDFRIDHRAGMNVTQEISPRVTARAEGELWRVSDPTSLPRMGVARSMSPVLYGTAQVGLDTLLSRRLILGTQYRFEGSRIYADNLPVSQVHQPSAELWYRLSPRSSVGTEYRFQYFSYGAQKSTGNSPAALFRYRLNRQMTFTARGGAVWYQELSGQSQGVAPRVHLQLDRNVAGFELGVQAGQDVLGATGFSDAVWAQYAGIYAGVRISERFRIYGNTYGFRNGEAPGGQEEWLGMRDGLGMSQGYGVGGGAEWSFNKQLVAQLQLDRVAQVGAYGPDANLSRNIAAVRLVVTPW